jgi:hypothetical protein
MGGRFAGPCPSPDICDRGSSSSDSSGKASDQESASQPRGMGDTGYSQKSP